MTGGTVLLSPFSNAWVVRMNGKLKSRQKGSIAKIIWIPGHIIFGWAGGTKKGENYVSRNPQ